MTAPVSNDIDYILGKYWGYESFRPMQREIIESVLAGKDTIGLLPTGGGKSITFQVPALALSGLTIVVTPLISLMKDQVDNLRMRGINGVYLHSGLSQREHRLAIDICRLGKAKLLYVSPEKLSSASFKDIVRELDVSLIVVDEAHCISQWGYDFRPGYLKISSIRQLFPEAPLLALTASATPRVIEHIADKLAMKSPAQFRLSFARPNISYVVRRCDYKEGKIIEILTKIGGSAIVYTRSRKRTRELALMLKENGISADYYHAGLLPEEKDEKQNAWKEGKTRVIVATNAFGMGIDKPDVRIVIHHDVPSTLEEYYQEAGRAGRDGLPSFAVLLCSRHDKGLLTRRLSDAFPQKDVIREVYEQVGNFLNVAVGEGYDRLFEFNLEAFCDTFERNMTIVRNALQILTRAGYIDFAEEITTGSRVMVLMKKHDLYDLKLSRDEDNVLQSILRNHTGLFTDYAYIDEKSLSRKLSMTEETVYQSLLSLNRQHVIHYIPRKTSPYILYTTSREEPKHLLFPVEVYEQRREIMALQLEAVKQFAFGDEDCRVEILLHYFGELPEEPCGTCDVCRETKRTKNNIENDLRRHIIYLASHPGGRTINEIVHQVGPYHKKTLEMIRLLLDENVLSKFDDRIIFNSKNIS